MFPLNVLLIITVVINISFIIVIIISAKDAFLDVTYFGDIELRVYLKCFVIAFCLYFAWRHSAHSYRHSPWLLRQ